MPETAPLHARHPFRLPLALLACMALAGCATSAGLLTQETLDDPDTLDATRTLKAAREGETALPTETWWSKLGDPQLDDLIAEALADNPSLDVAEARIRAARATVALSEAAGRPMLSASGRYSGVRLPSSILGDELGGKTRLSPAALLDFSWSPDIWGGQRAEVAAAVGQARATALDAAGARLDLAANVARAYVGLAEAIELRDASRREQQRLNALQSLGEQRVAAGLDNARDLHQTRSLLAASRAQETVARQRIETTRTALAALLGKGPDRGLDISAPALLTIPAPRLPGQLPSELLARRPDLLAARWRVESAAHDIDVKKAAFKPSFNLTLLAGLVAPNPAALLHTDALFGFGGPALGLPIFEGGRLQAALEGADARYDQAVASYNAALVQALREVADALQAIGTLEARSAELSDARSAAYAALDVAVQRHDAGIGTRLDVLSAQAPLLRLEEQLASLRAQRYGAVIDLYQALGGGVTPSPDVASPNTAFQSTP